MTPAVRAILFGAPDVDALLWKQAIRAVGADVSAARLGQVSALIRGLKVAGLWTSLDRLWLHAAENASQALIDIKALATATAVNTPTLTPDRGYTGNGTTSYLNLNFNPSTAGGNYVQDSATYGFWMTTDTGVGANARVMGNNDSTWQETLLDTTTSYKGGINQTIGPISFTPANRIGLYAAERTTSTAFALYLKGAVGISGTQASSAPSSANFFLLAANNGGTPAIVGFNCTIGASFFGSALGATKQAAFYAAMRSYMTAIGAP